MDKIFYPLELLANWLVHNIFNIQKSTHLADALIFLIADVLKIFILLAVIIFIVSLLRSFLPPSKIRKILTHKYQFTGNILAAAFGIITPFCTCSAIPLFLGFVQAGVPLGVTFSFLVASPMINEVAIVLLLGLFGWKITLLYILSGMAIAIIAGLIIGKMGAESLIEDFVYTDKIDLSTRKNDPTWKNRLDYARKYTVNIIRKVWLYIIIGVGLGAWIHGYIPTDFLTNYAGSDKWYAVPLATLIGIPLYSNAAGVMPLVSALTEKGVAMGTTLAFMMAVTGLSLPEFMILKKVMKVKLIIIFASTVSLGIIFTGYLFNYILK